MDRDEVNQQLVEANRKVLVATDKLAQAKVKRELANQLVHASGHRVNAATRHRDNLKQKLFELDQAEFWEAMKEVPGYVYNHERNEVKIDLHKQRVAEKFSLLHTLPRVIAVLKIPITNPRRSVELQGRDGKQYPVTRHSNYELCFGQMTYEGKHIAVAQVLRQCVTNNDAVGFVNILRDFAVNAYRGRTYKTTNHDMSARMTVEKRVKYEQQKKKAAATSVDTATVRYWQSIATSPWR